MNLIANFIVGLTLASIGTVEAAETQIRVQSDPSASYFVLSLKKLKKPIVQIETRREGSSGISFARREVNCSRMTFRYTGDAETEDDLASQKLGGKFGPLVDSSISDVISRYACRSAK